MLSLVHQRGESRAAYIKIQASFKIEGRTLISESPPLKRIVFELTIWYANVRTKPPLVQGIFN